jgi:Transposase zinc-binding domain
MADPRDASDDVFERSRAEYRSFVCWTDGFAKCVLAAKGATRWGSLGCWGSWWPGNNTRECNHCGQEVFSYHSCKNRSCCKCHTDDTQRWLEARKLEMLPCHYFLYVFPAVPGR